MAQWLRVGDPIVRITSGIMIALMAVGCTQAPNVCADLPQDNHQANAGCLIVSADRVLMIEQISGNWSVPGGTALAGERAVCTAQRETYEETGYAVAVTGLLHQFENGFRLYQCTLTNTAPSRAPDKGEVSSVAWLDATARAARPWRFEQQRALIDQLAASVSDVAN